VYKQQNFESKPKLTLFVVLGYELGIRKMHDAGIAHDAIGEIHNGLNVGGWQALYNDSSKNLHKGYPPLAQSPHCDEVGSSYERRS
jgi:hypothetical protein